MATLLVYRGDALVHRMPRSPKEFEKGVGRFAALLESVRIASPAGQDHEP